MDPRIETVTNEWRFRSCEPGYAGLHALAEGGFSGSVAAEGATGFMVNGRLVGISGGTIESFWSSDIAALEATEPTQALLCAMLIADDSVEGEYYTGETPITTVHETLASGSFSGYIELSENVFSGDYFVLYHGGTTKSVALLGTEERVVTGDEAFERASDEVGIYEVKSVTIELVEIPDPEVDDSVTEGDESEAEATPAAPDVSDEADSVADEPADPSEAPAVRESTQPEPSPVEAEPDPAPAEPSVSTTTDSTAGERDLAALAEAARGGEAAAVARSGRDDVSTAEEWVVIPALDPGESIAEPEPEPEPQPQPAPDPKPESEPVPQPTQSSATEPADSSAEAALDQGTIAELSADLDAANRENDRLRDRVSELEARIAELEGATGGDDFSPVEAIGGTNLFVRYATKGRNTLEDAVKSGTDRDAIVSNLDLERHTQFDETDATVDGEPFAEFLPSTLQYRFVSWLLGDLLFELRDSGREAGFEAMVGAFPEVDRIEFGGTVPIHTEEAGERRSEQFTFDIVFRDSMGAALLIANVHDDRNPVGGTPVADLLAEANAVATAKPSLTGAFFVARSYFEPEAMETVADATGGGLLRGGSRESYVSVSRKHGFHLCLIEARNSSFHLNVPD